ncbi:MAG: hypothetical protein ACOYL6_17510 [Bacteriovoracaceae bacterium]
MCDSIKWFIEGRMIELISAIGALISGYMGYKVYDLDKRVSNENLPRVSIWFDNSCQDFDGILGELTFINLGKEALPIRTLALLHGNPEKRISSCFKEKRLNESSFKNSYNFLDSQNDYIFVNNKIEKLVLYSPGVSPSQFIIRAMYFDNTFEIINIDTSNLGGKYFLTGKGIK